MKEFIFATGIECSYPTVPQKDGGNRRVDELALTGHYDHWKQDFQLTKELGIKHLRCGPPYYKTHMGPGRYDWSFADETFAQLRELGITPIADLCHFGVPDWIGDFQNRDWPTLFAEYALAFAQRFPWITLYTPVNEIYTVALNSGKNGMWNEALRSDSAFVLAMTNLCRANLLAMSEILSVCPEAEFVQSEASQYFHPATPEAIETAYFLNQLRFLSFDLTYAFPVSAPTFRYLIASGMKEQEFDWFMNHTTPPKCVMGTDYYGKNEHIVDVEGNRIHSGTLLGFSGIIRQYHQRYGLKLMLTETNVAAPKAVSWLHETWANVCRLRLDDLPVVGFTWYSLTDQVDWDTSLVQNNNHVNPFGLVDLDRNIRDVGHEFRKLISDWHDISASVSDARLRHYW